MGKVRVSNHIGRGTAKHNGRGFDVSKAKHIDPSRTKYNKCWCAIVGDDGKVKMRSLSEKKSKELAELEKAYYEAMFGRSLEAQNERYRAKRQYKYCKTMADIYQGAKTQPVEMIMQIGDKSAGVPIDTFRKAQIDWSNWLVGWNKQHGGHLHVLSNAIHADEDSPHAHIRWVWACDGPDGLKVAQDKAMEQAGVELPNPSEPRGKYNNRAQTFTKMCRDKWIEICQGYGFDVELEPVPGRKHKSKADYIAEQESKRVKELEARERAVEARERALAQVEADYTAQRRAALEALQTAQDEQREYTAKVAAWAKQHGYGKQARQMVSGSAARAERASAARRAATPGRSMADIDAAVSQLTRGSQDNELAY